VDSTCRADAYERRLIPHANEPAPDRPVIPLLLPAVVSHAGQAAPHRLDSPCCLFAASSETGIKEMPVSTIHAAEYIA
jgi:hypothetical protein